MMPPAQSNPSGSIVTEPFPRGIRYGPAEREAVLALMDTERLSETGRGPATSALEDAYADFVGTRHALSFNSGTASLHAALHAVEVGPERGVAAAPMTWISALTAIFQAGSYPVFCDVEPDSPNISPESAAAVAAECAAVLATHAWGIPARVDELTRDCDLPLVEDCSHAHGAVHAGRPVGSWGTAGCFSLQESKAVSGGEGGVLTTSDRAVYERALTLGHHPHRLETELADPDLTALAGSGASYKFRIPALAAVIAYEQLRGLPTRNADAEANWRTLHEVITCSELPIQFPRIAPGSVRGWYGTPLVVTDTVQDPAALFAECAARGIPLRALYPDWLASPLLQRPDLLARFWPHITSTDYRPPDPESFTAYQQLRRQMLIVKIPDVPAPDYMEQVGDALAAALTRTTATV